MQVISLILKPLCCGMIFLSHFFSLNDGDTCSRIDMQINHDYQELRVSNTIYLFRGKIINLFYMSLKKVTLIKYLFDRSFSLNETRLK